jgi:DMSO/TMAO reductase YedYZ molybdopterin-dependent catalytic subunit
LAAAAGLAVAEGVAAAISGPSPVVSVGTWVIDTSPSTLTHWAIEHFRADDKKVLVTGVLSTVALLAAVFGAIGVRARRMALAMTAGLGTVALIAVATVRGSHGDELVRITPALLALLVSTIALDRLLRAIPVDEPELAAPVLEMVPARASLTVREPGDPTGEAPSVPERPAVIIPGRRPAGDLDRRQFVRTASAVGAVALGGGLLREIAGSSHGRAGVIARLPAPYSPARTVVGADFGLPGLAPYFTANGDFYRVDTSIQVPQLDARTWELHIDGMVENPVTIRYADLLAARLIERDVTLTCVSNEVGGDLIGNARWLGLPVRELLAAAKPKPGANAVRSHSVDGWTAGTPLSALTDPGRDAMLAIGMNGVPLPAQHGYPVRMVVPGLYGYVSATKWVVRLEVTRFDAFQAYWTSRGWAPQGPIKTESRIDVPKSYPDVRLGAGTVAGMAWAQHRGIEKVEVQVDNGPWQTATLASWNNPDTWRQWRLGWTAPAGSHNLAVRATDATGAVQVAANAPPAPDGATGYDTESVQVTA